MIRFPINRQMTAREMLVEREGTGHSTVELRGGPLDGQRFHEEGGARFSHDSREKYSFAGAEYRPSHVEGSVLVMVHVCKQRNGKH